MISRNDSARIYLRGPSSELLKDLRETELFVLSSRYEGFGNVLAEALCMGCRCISFDVDHGPAEILRSGEFGRLVPERSAAELARAIEGELIEILDFDEYAINQARVVHCEQFTVESFRSSLRNNIARIIPN